MDSVSLLVPVRDVETPLHPLPPGLDEVLLQSAGPPGRARNRGFTRTKGSIILLAEDDHEIVGEVDWLRHRPATEIWWTATGYVDRTGDKFTEDAARFCNVFLALRNILGVGPVVGVRRWAYEAVGGYDERDLLGDLGFAKKLYRAFGWPKAAMPLVVNIWRPQTPLPALMEQRGRWFEGELPTDGPFRRLVAASPTADRAPRAR